MPALSFCLLVLGGIERLLESTYKRKHFTTDEHKKSHLCDDVIRCHGDDEMTSLPIHLYKILRAMQNNGHAYPYSLQKVHSHAKFIVRITMVYRTCGIF